MLEESSCSKEKVTESPQVSADKEETVIGYDEHKLAVEVGSYFDSPDALFSHYKRYGKQEGFGVKKTALRNSPCGKLKHITLSCSRAGKSEVAKQNHVNQSPQTKIDCKARINATMWENRKCRINSFMSDHNHGLIPQKLRSYLCNREIGAGVRSKLGLNDQVGMNVSKNASFVTVEVGVNDEVMFNVEKARHLLARSGDAKAVHDFFVTMQSKSSNFFYVMDVDGDSRVKNMFWADARSRAAYEEFGDVIALDTTYLSNNYELPIVTFVGVNHHGQLVLLGCGVLSNQDTTTLTWLFKMWLESMSGCAPNAIITDQDKAMQKAVAIVFPNSRHRWCLWHVMKKIPEKLGGLSSSEKIEKALKSVVYNSLTKEEFQGKWGSFVEEFALSDNAWLDFLYEQRHRWAPVFVKDTFWAGTSTTKGSESMISFFDGCVNTQTTLKQFVERYGNALRDKIEKEDEADFQSSNLLVPCVTPFGIEKQFQAVYTNSKFKEFQNEVSGKLYCDVSSEHTGVFDVIETVFIEENSLQVHYTVRFDKDKCDMNCDCRLFEFKGILCKHILSILMKNHIKEVPEKYVLARWRKDLKRSHSRVKICNDNWFGSKETKRYDKLRNKFDEVADWAVVSDENCEILWNTLDNFQMRFNSFRARDPSKAPAEINIRSQKRKQPIVSAKRKKKNNEEKTKVINLDDCILMDVVHEKHISSVSNVIDTRMKELVHLQEKHSKVSTCDDGSPQIQTVRFEHSYEACTQ